MAAELKTAGRGAISPAAIWRATPGSTTSVRPAVRADDNDGSRAGIASILPRTMTIDDTDHDSDGFDGDDGDGDSDYA